MLRLALFVGMTAAGFALVVGLCAGALQAVHVILFFALTLIVPWLVFLLFGLVGLVLGQRRALLERAPNRLFEGIHRVFQAPVRC